MNDAVIVQSAMSKGGGEYYPHLALSVPIHAAYAKRHNFDYRAEFGDVSEFGSNTAGGYAKIEMLIEAAKKYRYVVWIDCDAIIVNDKVDLRDAFQEGKHISLVRYDRPKTHLNVGVMFVRGGAESVRLLEIIRNTPARNDWFEQQTINDMLDSDDGKYIGEIDKRWNTWVCDKFNDDDVIHGYHSGLTKPQKLEFIAYEVHKIGQKNA